MRGVNVDGENRTQLRDGDSWLITPQFKDFNEACQGLLLTTTHVLAGAGVGFVIAGGWVPVLLGEGHETLVHPGTRDVDVLLTGDRIEAKRAAQALLSARFRPSAKHEFQLLRDANVSGTDFVFNVDLMHPKESTLSPGSFEDIFDLGISDAYDPRGSRFLKSIAFKSAAIVTEQKLFEVVAVSGTDLDGKASRAEVPVLDFSALVLSKAESVSVRKRTRDAFDIYYALTGPLGAKAAASLQRLAAEFEEVGDQLELLRAFLDDHPDRFNANVGFHSLPGERQPAAETLSILFGPMDA